MSYLYTKTIYALSKTIKLDALLTKPSQKFSSFIIFNNMLYNWLQETIETPLQSPPTREGAEEMPSSTSSAKSATTSEEVTPSNEGLHCLGLDDLGRALAEAKMLKCVSFSF